jgi:CRP-like cAMP-binding protein
MKKHRLSKKFTLESRDRIDISLENLIELIKMPQMKRSKSDSRLIQNYLCQNFDYFKKLTQDPDGKEKIPKIIAVLNYETFRKDEHIIHYGEIGDKFYILLSGTVSIYKPSPKNVNMTLHDYVDYLVKIRDLEKNLIKFERVQNYNSSIDRVKLLVTNYNSSKLPYSNKKIPVVIEEERFILKLGPGTSFGEMALIKNETRNANIVANENCELVSIDKVDYRKIIKDIEEQRINSKLKNFKLDYPYFQEWPGNRCYRLLSSFAIDYYSRGDYVYKQNSLSNFIYFIKKGEFEVTSDINFSWYEKFIEYIHDSSESLINDMDNASQWKEDNLQQRINQANENNKSPCILTLPRIERAILSHRNDEKSNLNIYDDMKINNDKGNNTNINEGKKDENETSFINSQNQNNLIRRINIKKLEAPQIFGFVEPFELKRRFCNIKCISREGIVQKIPFIEFLQLLPKDKKNRFFLEQNIFNIKKELIEQLRNGALVKLSFNYNKKNIKAVKIYPGRNMDKIPKKKPQILIKSISMIRLNQNQSYNNDNNEKNDNNISLINKEFPMKIKKNIILGFKKSLFSFSKKKINSMNNNFLPISLLSQKNKQIFFIKKNKKSSVNISNSSIKYLEDNNSSTVLPTKTSLVPIYDSTGKNYINSSAGKIMNKLFTRNNLSDFTNGNKNYEISFPSIENKKMENYSYKGKLQNKEIIQNKKKVSRSLLNNKEYKFLFS